MVREDYSPIHPSSLSHTNTHASRVFDNTNRQAGYPAAEHTTAFELAHKQRFGKTVHAGEAWGPESVFQAITGAERGTPAAVFLSCDLNN